MSQSVNFLRNQTHVAEEIYQWGASTLQVQAYISDHLPPDEMISSVRAIVQQDGQILVIDDPNGEVYVTPGGRCESGETVLETLERELLEETGWMLRKRQLLGFMHFHHLTPKPDGYRYPYPDFFQVVYCGEADKFYSEKMVEDEFVVGSQFRPITDTLIASISLLEQAYLKAMQHILAG